MIRRLVVPLVLLSACACAASAAAPVRVSLVKPVPTATAGRAWTVTLAVSPSSFAGSVRVTATGPRRLVATARGGRGSYRARFVFPSPGRWTLTARAGSSTSQLGSVAVRQAPATPLTLVEPTSIELEPSGTLLVVENSRGRVLRVDPARGSVAVVASGLSGAYAVARAPSGAIVVSAGNQLRRVGGSPANVAEVDDALGPLAVGADGDIVFASEVRVFRLASGASTPVRIAGGGAEGGSGDGGPAVNAQVAGPHGLAVARDGALLVADTRNNRLRRIDPTTRVITTFARVDTPLGMDIGGDGSIYVVDGRASRVVRLSPSGDRLGLVGPVFRTPYDVEVAGDGTIYVLEAGPSGRIKRIAPNGTVTTISRR